jgi:hypothetical protein
MYRLNANWYFNIFQFESKKIDVLKRWPDLHDLKGQPKVVELDGVVHPLQGDAARLVEVVELRRRPQEEPLG